MAEAQLRWKAQTSEAEARILALKAVVDSLGGEQTTTRLRSVSSSLDKIGTDAEKAGKKADYAFRDAFKAVDKFGAGLSGPFGILKPIGLLIQGWSKVSQVVGIGTKALGDALTPIQGIATEGEQAAGALTSMGSTMGPLVTAAGPVVAILLAMGGALLVLPALIAAVAFAATALVDTLSILGAVVAGLTGPILTVVGLLGGLGLAFAYVAKQSFQNSASMDTQKLALEKLHIAQQTYNTDVQKYGKNATQTQSALVSLQQAQDAYAKSQVGVALSSAHLSEKFHQLIQQLTIDFTPEIVKLADAAGKALTYLDKVSKMDLTGAFKSLNTRGVKLFSEFADGVGKAIAKPIRLAIKLAFGKQSNIGNVLGDWLHDISNFLTGVHGAANPFVKWFNQQHFTSTGMRWASEIINAITHSAAWAGFKDAIVAIAKSAGAAAGHAFVQAFVAEIESLPGIISGFISGSGPAVSGQGRGGGAVPPGALGGGYGPGDVGGQPGNPVPVRGHRAAGGVVSPNSSYIVGEQGEEMLTLGPHGGYITPAGPRHGTWTRPQIIQLHVDLGRGVKQVVQFELRNTARGLQAARAWGG